MNKKPTKEIIDASKAVQMIQKAKEGRKGTFEEQMLDAGVLAIGGRVKQMEVITMPDDSKAVTIEIEGDTEIKVRFTLPIENLDVCLR